MTAHTFHDPHNRSIGELLGDLTTQTRALISKEFALAKAEINQKISRITRSGVWFAAAGVLAFSGLMTLLASAVLGLYTQVAEGFHDEFPPLTSGPVAGLARQLGLLGSHGRSRYYKMLEDRFTREEGGRYLDRSQIPASQRRFLAFAEAYRFYDRPGSRDPEGPTVVPAEPKVPEIDFTKKLVLVGLSLGGPNRPGLNASLDEKGNLRTTYISTLIGGPGFGYSLAVFDRKGIKTINGKEIPK